MSHHSGTVTFSKSLSSCAHIGEVMASVSNLRHVLLDRMLESGYDTCGKKSLIIRSWMREDEP
jgi:hypothetical protein